MKAQTTNYPTTTQGDSVVEKGTWGDWEGYLERQGNAFVQSGVCTAGTRRWTSHTVTGRPEHSLSHHSSHRSEARQLTSKTDQTKASRRDIDLPQRWRSMRPLLGQSRRRTRRSGRKISAQSAVWTPPIRYAFLTQDSAILRSHQCIAVTPLGSCGSSHARADADGGSCHATTLHVSAYELDMNGRESERERERVRNVNVKCEMGKEVPHSCWPPKLHDVMISPRVGIQHTSPETPPLLFFWHIRTPTTNPSPHPHKHTSTTRGGVEGWREGVEGVRMKGAMGFRGHTVAVIQDPRPINTTPSNPHYAR